MAGDANRIVTAGTGRKVIWNPNLDWPLQSAANVSATVKAWTKDVPPDYMAVRLRDDGTDLKLAPVRIAPGTYRVPVSGDPVFFAGGALAE